PQHQLPITLPVSSYDPAAHTPSTSFLAAGFRGFANEITPSFANSVDGSGGPTLTHKLNAIEQHRSSWGGFALNQGFSPVDGYSGPVVYDSE
ncbi:100_t:CDS:1, partial [Acaulospora colombiana]